MSIFDKPIVSSDLPVRTFTFPTLPESLQELQSLPEAVLNDPYQTAALTVLALCAYAAEKNIGAEMLNWLRGPRPLSNFDISFITTASGTERPIFPSLTLRVLLPGTIIHPISPMFSPLSPIPIPTPIRDIRSFSSVAAAQILLVRSSLDKRVTEPGSCGIKPS